jgi:hypothetical protein
VKLAKGIRKIEGPYPWRARIEGAGTEIRGSVEVVWKIQTVLESAGVEFIPADEIKSPKLNLCSRRRE